MLPASERPAPDVPEAGAPAVRGTTPTASDLAATEARLRQAMQHLERLVATLQPHVPVVEVERRDRSLAVEPMIPATAEQRLRAVGALLTTVHAYQRSRRSRDRTAHATVPVSRPRPGPTTTAQARSTDQSNAAAEQPAEPHAALAAAAARYIARDLAARRLSEFTSAEAYRLARALARIGGVEAPVEDLLVEANRVRLHPPPLTDAVSRSAV